MTAAAQQDALSDLGRLAQTARDAAAAHREAVAARNAALRRAYDAGVGPRALAHATGMDAAHALRVARGW